MNSMPTAAVQARLYQDTGEAFLSGSKLAFLALATLLISITYAMPIGAAWKRSTEENYVDLDRLEAEAEEGARSRQLGLASLGLLGLAGIAWHSHRKLRIWGWAGGLFLAYLAWCAASCLWADYPALSLRRFVGALCEVACAVAIVKHTSPRQFAWMVLLCCLTWVGLGVLAELSQGMFTPWRADYRFAGIFHPNDTGVVCSLLLFTTIYLLRQAQQVRLLLWAIAIIALGFLVLTGSRTSLAAAVLILIAAPIAVLPTQRALVVVIGGVGVVALLMLVVGLGAAAVKPDLLLMGRADSDVSSLTGRLPLWNILNEFYLSESPWLGYGYNGFWSPERVSGISGDEWGAVSTAHNVYYELALGVGYIGAALCVSAMLVALIQLTRLERRFSGAGYGMLAMILAFVLIAGFLETTFGATSYLSLFAVAAIAYVAFPDDAARAALAARHDETRLN